MRRHALHSYKHHINAYGKTSKNVPLVDNNLHEERWVKKNVELNSKVSDYTPFFNRQKYSKKKLWGKYVFHSIKDLKKKKKISSWVSVVFFTPRPVIRNCKSAKSSFF